MSLWDHPTLRFPEKSHSTPPSVWQNFLLLYSNSMTDVSVALHNLMVLGHLRFTWNHLLWVFVVGKATTKMFIAIHPDILFTLTFLSHQPGRCWFILEVSFTCSWEGLDEGWTWNCLMWLNLLRSAYVSLIRLKWNSPEILTFWIIAITIVVGGSDYCFLFLNKIQIYVIIPLKSLLRWIPRGKFYWLEVVLLLLRRFEGVLGFV